MRVAACSDTSCLSSSMVASKSWSVADGLAVAADMSEPSARTDLSIFDSVRTVGSGGIRGVRVGARSVATISRDALQA
eukprot:5452017-Prymnesium_polylepis.5